MMINMLLRSFHSSLRDESCRGRCSYGPEGLRVPIGLGEGADEGGPDWADRRELLTVGGGASIGVGPGATVKGL